MKKILIFSLLLIMVSPIFLCSEYRGYFDLSGSYLSHADTYYKTNFGEDSFLPELKAGIRIYNNFFLWAGYGQTTSKSESAFLLGNTRVSLSYLSGGLGYRFLLSDDFGVRIDAGLLYNSYKEKGEGTDSSGAGLGYRIEVGLIMYLGNIYIDFSNGFLSAKDDQGDINIKLGGYKVGLGIGYQF